jgi:hypothetical protein
MASAIHQRQDTTSHRSIVDSLARELELPFSEVETAYVAEVTRLAAGAKVKTFVSVLAAGSVRASMRRMHERPPGTEPGNVPGG